MNNRSNKRECQQEGHPCKPRHIAFISCINNPHCSHYQCYCYCYCARFCRCLSGDELARNSYLEEHCLSTPNLICLRQISRENETHLRPKCSRGAGAGSKPSDEGGELRRLSQLSPGATSQRLKRRLRTVKRQRQAVSCLKYGGGMCTVGVSTSI